MTDPHLKMVARVKDGFRRAYPKPEVWPKLHAVEVEEDFDADEFAAREHADEHDGMEDD